MVVVFIETPDDYSGWDQNSDGMYEATFVLEFEAKANSHATMEIV